jgi:hypothetical protein
MDRASWARAGLEVRVHEAVEVEALGQASSRRSSARGSTRSSPSRSTAYKYANAQSANRPRRSSARDQACSGDGHPPWNTQSAENID